MRTPLRTARHRVPHLCFTHCRGRGRRGPRCRGPRRARAVGFGAEQLEIELKWIDEHVGDKPYGVDIVIPGKYEGRDGRPRGARSEGCGDGFRPSIAPSAKRLLADTACRELRRTDRRSCSAGRRTAGPQIEVMLKHPKVKLCRETARHAAREIIREIQQSGRWRRVVRQRQGTRCPPRTSAWRRATSV